MPMKQTSSLSNFILSEISLKALLNRKTNTRNGTLLAALPHLLKKAIKSRKSDTEFTPQVKRVRYIDVCLNNDNDDVNEN
ncbi:hypothetical protein Glove_341g72 [Diversispora epigaea]|uniref:Uncharacterized protein n=1 Tax=Diversispora epigaea TaxID=1348612 RepID=A0A397HGJ7_9GLOM|nr:hypothetical protein Glove_341g71 [Diversispora epigaea]RHZ62264.1 hypothetical protein Glove_341g72 [Diversispora epigaea]